MALHSSDASRCVYSWLSGDPEVFWILVFSLVLHGYPVMLHEPIVGDAASSRKSHQEN